MSTIKIGKQQWATSNLQADSFKNGDGILEVKTYDDWMKAINDKTPARICFKNKKDKAKNYGYLYNWFAIIDKRGLAPEGLKIPSNDDWELLVKFLGGKKAGEMLKSDTLWKPSSFGEIGTNESGFNALPGGVMSTSDDKLTFSEEGKQCLFASNSLDTTGEFGPKGYVMCRLLWNISDECKISTNDKDGGFYVRCLVG